MIRFTVRVGALGEHDVDAPDPQRAAIAAAERSGSTAPVLCIVDDAHLGVESRWTVHHVEYRYARPA